MGIGYKIYEENNSFVYTMLGLSKEHLRKKFLEIYPNKKIRKIVERQNYDINKNEEQLDLKEIYPTVPDFVFTIKKSRRLNTIKIAVNLLEYLQKNCLGFNNSTCLREIIEDLDIPEFDKRTYANTRAIIRFLILNGALIGGNDRGYYWINTDEEFTKVLDRIDNNIKGFTKRRDALIFFYKKLKQEDIKNDN